MGIETLDSIYAFIKAAGSNMRLFDYSYLGTNTSGKQSTYYVLGKAKVEYSYYSPMYTKFIDGRERKVIHSRIDSTHENSNFRYSTDLYFADSIGLFLLDFAKVWRVNGDTAEQYVLNRY